MGSIPGVEGCFNIRKSDHVIHCMNKVKEKTYDDLNRCTKSIWQNLVPTSHKNSQRTEENFLIMKIKHLWKTSSSPHSWYWNLSAGTTLAQAGQGVYLTLGLLYLRSSHAIRQEKKNQHPDWKERIKTLFEDGVIIFVEKLMESN